MTADTQYYHVDIDKVTSLINPISVRDYENSLLMPRDISLECLRLVEDAKDGDATELRKLTESEAYSKMWIPLVKQFGGIHHGYFLPHEGPDNIALALFSFPRLAA